MPFKLLQTIEDGKFCYIVAPSAWEDDGVLFWPKGASVAKLLNDGDSVPTQKWDRMNCVKTAEFVTRAEAEEEQERRESGGGSGRGRDDDDEPPATKKKRKEDQPPPNPRRSPSSSSNNSVSADYDDPLHTPQRASPDAMIRPKVEAYAYVNPDSGNIEVQEETLNQAPPSISAPVVNPPGNSQCTHCHVILGNQHKIMQTLKQLTANVSFLMNTVASNGGGAGIGMCAPLPGPSTLQPSAIAAAPVMNMFSMPMDPDFVEVITNPIETQEDMERLEERLRDETVMYRFVNGMSYICGTNGKANGMDSCYKLIDHFLSRAFLVQCSWTGSSRTEGMPRFAHRSDPQGKIALKFYTCFRNLFLQLVRLADKDFTEALCEVFFKRVLKNSKVRAASWTGTASRHKNRPSQLKYKTKARREEADAPGGEPLDEWYEVEMA